MRKYITVMLDKNPTMDWEDLLPSMMLSYNSHVHRATGDSPFFLTFAHDPRLLFFDIAGGGGEGEAVGLFGPITGCLVADEEG
jgi:hypothetical protein